MRATDEMIEAAAEAMYRRSHGPDEPMVPWVNFNKGIAADYREDARVTLNAALALLPAPSADFVLVPRHTTSAMMNEGANRWKEVSGQTGPSWSLQRMANEVFYSMIAAAPSAAAEPKAGEN